MNIDEYLYNKRDDEYKKFNDKTINTSLVTLGVRTPLIKSLAKKLYKEKIEVKLSENDYYEKVLLKGYIISFEKDEKVLIKKLNEFIFYIDNWAICDLVCASSKALKNNPSLTLKFVKENILKDNFWAKRFAFVTLLNYFISKEYLDLIFEYCDNDKSDFYYVMMAKAWLISMCYIKYPLITVGYLKNCKLDKQTFNKAISKINDSLRVSKEDKLMIKSMKKK